MDNEIYVIDTSASIEFEGRTFNLSSGFPVKNTDGSYDSAVYTQARVNGLIIEAEVKKAYDAGFKKVRLNKGEYFVCACFTDYYYMDGCINFTDIHNMVLDFNGSAIKLIYDSNNYNQYCTYKQLAPWQQRAWVIVLRNCTDVRIENVELIGDAIDRAWVTNEEKMEHTCGLTIGQFCRNIQVENVKAQYFMGDGISGMFGTWPYLTDTFTQWLIDKTINETTGNIEDVAVVGNYHSLVSELIDFDSQYKSYSSVKPWSGTYREYIHAYSIKGFENHIQIRPYGETYTCQKDNYSWKCALYKRSAGALHVDKIIRCDAFQIIDISNYAAIRLIIDNDEIDFGTDDVSNGVWVHNFKIAMSQVLSHNIIVNNSYIANGHRGGMSNMPNNTKIANTTFFNCGMDCGIGAPLFPDSTRYCIDQEEQFIDNLNIENCKFYRSLNATIINAKIFEVANCQYSDAGGIQVNTCETATIRNSTFVNGAISSNTNVIGWRGGKNMCSVATIENCVITTYKRYIIEDVQRRKMHFKNCIITLTDMSIQNNEDVCFDSCKITLTGEKISEVENTFSEVKIINSTLCGRDEQRVILTRNIDANNTNISNIKTKCLTDECSIKGLSFDNTCSVTVYSYRSGTEVHNIIKFEECNFEGQIESMDNNLNKNGGCYIYRNCAFYLPDKPIKVMAWGSDLAQRQTSMKLIRCNFVCDKTNVFAKYASAQIPINVKFFGCAFGI